MTKAQQAWLVGLMAEGAAARHGEATARRDDVRLLGLSRKTFQKWRARLDAQGKGRSL